ncbi:MAG: hypothetical protein JXA90_01705, partial [Planctomycetes bacterium]|nr:hypothetical protein [Planctomycetota bacterium]
DHFTRQINAEEGSARRFGESALKILTQYSWPGNVREMCNLIRRLLLTSPRRVVTRREVSEFLQSSQAATCLGENVDRDGRSLLLRIPLRQRFHEIIDECERLVLLNALKENGWNKSRVTKILGIPRQSLYNKISKHNLQQSWGEE